MKRYGGALSFKSIIICILMLGLIVSTLSLAQQERERLISLSFENADVRTVLRTFAELGKVNIVASEKVSGRVTLRLEDVPWEQAFQTVLQVHGLTAVEQKGIIGVITMEESEEQKRIIPLETKILRIKYAKASSIENAISPMLTERGKSKVDERTNSLIICDIPTTVSNIERFVDKIDTPTPQVMIEAKIVEVDYKAARELGIEWRAKFTEPTVETHVEGGVTAPITGVSDIIFGTLLSGVNLEAKLLMLESKDKARILSQPKVAVIDNEEAMILSGKKIPIITLDRAGNQIIQFYDVALKLTVKPHINPENQVVLDLHPEVSDLSSEATVAGGVIILSSEANTSLMVNDGQTVVIGGIVREKTGEVIRGVPIISSIPLIGRLFKSKSKTQSKSELLVFVTPHIIPVEKK
ncbi:MAG: secretin N-terminal domain-containing protein [bacterium]|nr:secretin N-terminal domain-containing protein [bacterium]